ncbi:MAG: L,D-transpeptidase family protein, partial [Eubacterium sp.]|nr:L,D-transpeptidase family protein [Eubacterium sp.]
STEESQADNKKTQGKWIEETRGWWYDNGDGTYAKSEYIDGYWLDANGWYDPAWYGNWNKNNKGWWFESGSWYPKNSWLKVNKNWYYFDENGYMKSSEWVKSSGNWYYMTESGAMAYNTTVDNYKIGADGVRIDETDIKELIEKSETAKKTTQIVLVVDHELTFWQKNQKGEWENTKEMYCCYGKNGFSDPEKRVMGDMTTPLGSYELTYAFGIAENPGTKMTYRDITPKSYLSSEEATYNTWVESDTWVNGEHLIDYTVQYKYAANIGFNINPTVYRRGAGIFLHCHGDKNYTAGCISVTEENMVWLLKQFKNGAYIILTEDKSQIKDY